jgi:hypothetical protein
MAIVEPSGVSWGKALLATEAEVVDDKLDAADVGVTHIVVTTKEAITPATTRRTAVDHEPRTIFMEVEIIATDISVNNLKKYSEFVQAKRWLVI